MQFKIVTTFAILFCIFALKACKQSNNAGLTHENESPEDGSEAQRTGGWRVQRCKGLSTTDLGAGPFRYFIYRRFGDTTWQLTAKPHNESETWGPYTLSVSEPEKVWRFSTQGKFKLEVLVPNSKYRLTHLPNPNTKRGFAAEKSTFAVLECY